MQIEIKNRFNDKVLFALETKSLKLAVEVVVKSKANLRGADLREANLREADLRGADLWRADLREANLWRADLREANLWEADLWEAKIKFSKFPSISLLSNINLGQLPSNIAKELMRRDAAAHPHPEKFIKWAKGGDCPYQNEELFWKFKQERKVWRRGKPTMSDADLIFAICKAKGWEIEGYLEK